MKEFLLNRIITGNVDFSISGEKFVLGRFSRESKYKAEQIYEDMLYELSFSDLLTEEDILFTLLENGIWSAEKNNEIEDLEKGIDIVKTKMFEHLFQKKEREAYRKQLNVARKRHSELFNQRHVFDHLTAKGVAMLAKTNYLICSNLIDKNNKKIWKDDSFVKESVYFLTDLIEQYNQKRVTESQVRDIARTEPWRSTWVLGKKEGSIFGIPAVDYTEDQKFLSIWSSIYDSVYESSECPPDFAVEDDDLLDGWMITQRRKREDESFQRRGESMINEKLAGAEEVYFVANTAEDAAIIDRFNTPEAKRIKQERFAHLNKHGTLNEMDMPDTKRKYQEEMMNAYRNAVNKSKGV